jgi:hypothetical protein
MRLLFACVVVLVAGVASVQTAHPCDIQPAGPWVQRTGKAPVVGWCQAGEHGGFIVSIDGALFDIQPVPAVGGVGIYGTYYEIRWPGSVGRGQHTFGVRAYTGGGGMQGPQAVLTFSR